MSDFVKNISKTVLAQGWGRLSEHVIDVKRRDGTWQRQKREIYERGSAAVCLVRNPETDQVLLTRQFRFPSYLIGRDAHMIEAPAGMLEGAEPETRMLAELEEETGYRVSNLQHLYNLISSPGGFDESVDYFIGEYRAQDRISEGGGLEHEGEDIEVMEIALDEALRMIKTGEIFDAKTVILLQHYALER